MKWYLYNPERDDAFIAVVHARSKEEAALRFSRDDAKGHNLSKEEIEADVESILDQYIFVPENELYDVDEEAPSTNLINAKKAREQLANKGYGPNSVGVQKRQELTTTKKAQSLDLDVADIDLDVEDISLDAGQLKIPDVEIEEINIGM